MTKAARLVLTIGDPAGIGSEIVLKALADPRIRQLPAKITVIGDRRQVSLIYCHLKAQQKTPSPYKLVDPDRLVDVEWLDLPSAGTITLGIGDRHSGAASFSFLDLAITETLAGKFDGMVTAPIAKSAWKLAGHDYPGQTELLAARTNIKDFGMLFVGRSPHTGWILRTLLATVHIPLAQVAQVLTPDLVNAKLELFWRSLQQDFGLKKARVAIAGINPHSGEQGQLGKEEQTWLNPLIQAWQDRYLGFEVIGAIPPDTLWIKPGQAWYKSTELGLDGYLAMYHDQGLIPVKLLAFEQAVNTTVGLPFVRTSPDHGTAFDIAGRGIANPESLIAAILWAVEMIASRNSTNA
jgi:4-hydroxythreonine-4-phosphate dehydrogenase